MLFRFGLVSTLIYLLTLAGYVNALTSAEVDEVNKALADSDMTQEEIEFVKQKLGIRGPAKAPTQETANIYFSDAKVAELAMAASDGDIKRIDELVEGGVDVNTLGKDNMTPLLWVLQTKNLDGFHRLLEHGADPNIVSKERYGVMWFVVQYDTPDFLKLALQYGGDPDWLNPVKGETLIFKAISFALAQGLSAGFAPDNAENAKLLIEAGADVNLQQGIIGKTPLHAAGIAAQYQIVYMLLEAGADPRINTKKGKNGLLWAIEKTSRPGSDEMYQWRQKVIEYLRAAGMEINPKYP